MGSTKKEKESFRPTIFERLLSLSRIPYTLGITFFAIFVGPLGNFLFLYSVSNDALNALYGAFMFVNAGEAGFIAAPQSHWYSFAGNILWYAFLFYAAFIVKYLRMRLIKADPELVSLAPGGEETVRRIFRHVPRAIPQLLMTSVFLLIYAMSAPELLGRGEFTVFSGPIYVLRSLFRSLLLGSVLWLYCGFVWGLYRFGKQNLRLKSYCEDPMLGAKKLGSLSFSFSSAYFLGLVLFGAQMTLGVRAGLSAIANVVVVLILVPAGIVLFVAPLASTHDRMVEVKRAEIASTGKLLSELLNRISEPGQKDDRNVIELMMLETKERKAMSIKTWPVESPLIGRLALVATSVAAALITRLIQIILNV